MSAAMGFALNWIRIGRRDRVCRSCGKELRLEGEGNEVCLAGWLAVVRREVQPPGRLVKFLRL